MTRPEFLGLQYHIDVYIIIVLLIIHDNVFQVNRAVAILYARRVLLSLLDNWPSNGPPITADMIGCKDSSQVPYVLDLLNRTEQVDSFQEVSLTVA